MSDATLTFTVTSGELLPKAVWSYLVKVRANWTCEECGDHRPPTSLHWQIGYRPLCAHHMDGNGNRNVLSNGECLCPRCHAIRHVEMKRAAA